MPKPRIMFYHDGRHPHIYRYEPPMHREEYQACMDELATTSVEAVMFCLGEGRTVLHDTRVGELLGHNVDMWDHAVFRRAYQNARHLIDEGSDPLRIVCDRAHEKGLLLYPTLLVQNGGEDHAAIRNSDFRLENKHLEIGARGDLPPDMPGIDGLDFKHEEARNERFDLIEETLNNYPVDGFELQLANTFPLFFHPDEVEEGRPIMTEWIRRVFEAVRNSGPGRELVIRLPRSLEDCRATGLDPEDWIRQGIVDVLVGEITNNPDYIDPTADLRPLLEAARGSDCRIHASLHTRVGSDRLSDAPISMVRAAACNYWAQGVDGLYLAQWFTFWPYGAEFYERLRELPHPDIMAAKDKCYYVPTEADRARPEWDPPPLPIVMGEGETARARLPISDDLPHWAARNRVHEVLLRIGIAGVTEQDRVSFRLNGQDLPASSARRINQMYRMSAPRNRSGPTYWFVFRLGPENWPRPGDNSLEVTLLERVPDLLGEVSLRDVELEIKYLMGKSFHRGYVDPDLGPYEHAVT